MPVIPDITGDMCLVIGQARLRRVCHVVPNVLLEIRFFKFRIWPGTSRHEVRGHSEQLSGRDGPFTETLIVT